jgi:hypothetical protein
MCAVFISDHKGPWLVRCEIEGVSGCDSPLESRLPTAK